MRFSPSVDAISLLSCIGKILKPDDPAIEIVLANCRDVLIPKGQLLYREGETAKYAYFIVSGKARSYYTDYAGRVITWSFHFNETQSEFKNLFVVDFTGLLTQTPGTMTVEALTDISAIRIGQHEQGAKPENLPVLDKWLRKLNEYFITMAYERFFTFLTLSATGRYNRLLENEAYLLQLFTDKHLASYIGVEPQSLSRIRKNLKSIPVQRNVRSFAG